MIVTFYSYKGGVGRSMALANVARWFQLQGLRVAVADWDLEAPGLESFLGAKPEDREALRRKMGLLELLTGYRDMFGDIPGLAAGASAAATAMRGGGDITPDGAPAESTVADLAARRSRLD